MWCHATAGVGVESTDCSVVDQPVELRALVVAESGKRRDDEVVVVSQWAARHQIIAAEFFEESLRGPSVERQRFGQRAEADGVLPEDGLEDREFVLGVVIGSAREFVGAHAML